MTIFAYLTWPLDILRRAGVPLPDWSRWPVIIAGNALVVIVLILVLMRLFRK